MGTEKIGEGDVVRLKSGGPCMTVEQLREPNDVECTVAWFDENSLQRATLRTASLRKKKGSKA
jgi:uncharacterized protein YodC (DUF2158 family)